MFLFCSLRKLRIFPAVRVLYYVLTTLHISHFYHFYTVSIATQNKSVIDVAPEGPASIPAQAPKNGLDSVTILWRSERNAPSLAILKKPDVATKEPTIRPQASADSKELFQLETEIFDCEIVSLRSFRRFVASSTIASYVACDEDGRLVGYATVTFRPRCQTARIYSIAVHPRGRRGGLGFRLLQTCEAAARERGCNRLRLEVRMDNPGAIAFYEKHGYERYGSRLQFYEDGTDALLLRKSL